MVICELSVEELKAPGAQVRDEVNQADLAGVCTAEVGAMEHGFAAEDFSEREAVEAADENLGMCRGVEMARGQRPRRILPSPNPFPLGSGFSGGQPGFDAVGVAVFVEEKKGLDDGRGEPSAFGGAVFGGSGCGGTGTDDGFEGLIGSDHKSAGSDPLGQGLGDVKSAVEWDDGPLAGLNPLHTGLLGRALGRGLGHGKPALGVGGKHLRNAADLGGFGCTWGWNPGFRHRVIVHARNAETGGHGFPRRRSWEGV